MSLTMFQNSIGESQYFLRALKTYVLVTMCSRLVRGMVPEGFCPGEQTPQEREIPANPV